MGCSTSKLDDEEAIKLCKDRRNFIKQAVEQRYRFAVSHINYIQSLKRVSLALLNYVEGDEHHDFISNSYTTPPFTPEKRLSPEITGIPLKSFEPTRVVNYLGSSGNPSVPIEEWPESPETVRVESYYPSNHYGIDGFFTSEASQLNPSFSSSPYNRPSYPPTSPQNSQDFFWNPFSSLDQYGYQFSNNLDDEMARLRQVREEEGIPELEELEEQEEKEDDDGEEEEENKESEEFRKTETKGKRAKTGSKSTSKINSNEVNRGIEKIYELKELQSQGLESIEISEARDAELKATNEEVVRNSGAEETPGFIVYVNRRPTSMVEVMKDVESQFVRICDAAHEVSVMLDANNAQYSSASNELAVRMLNPVALFGSTSSRSASSCFFQAASCTGDDGDESNSNYSEECCMIFGSHQSTLDRLYTWEKKLYEEVKCGERIRITYEKKCMQFKSHDVNGEEPSVVDKTRAAIRDLHTRLKVYIHSVESVSKRIETLRDEELYPQLMELIQGLTRMWRTMAECHRIQKRTIDEAKLLLFSSSSSTSTIVSPPIPSEASSLKLSKSATNLAVELKNWRSSLATWIEAQRSYARALAGWISRCAFPQHDADGRTARSPNSPRGTGDRAPPVFGVCVQWSRLLDSISEAPVIKGMDFFAAGIWSVSTQQREGAAAVEEGETMAAERTSEVGARVLCAGMSVAVGSLTEFATGSAEWYEVLLKTFEEKGRVEA